MPDSLQIAGANIARKTRNVGPRALVVRWHVREFGKIGSAGKQGFARVAGCALRFCSRRKDIGK